jgi:MFS family permease
MNQVAISRPEPPAAFRWIVLVVISLAMFGNYYIYDCVSPLADLLVKQLKFTDADIGLLQGIYSLPNIIMVLIGGLIIDKIGTKKANLIFAVLCMLGALITAMSSSLMPMAIGRLVFGLGAESMIVGVTTTLARWFKGKELSFAFGLNLTIARFGSFAALNSPTWGKSFFNYWQDPLWVALFAGVISVISVIVYFMLDHFAEKRYALKPEDAQEKIELKQVFNFGRSFWLISLLCVVFYSAMFPFQTFAVKFFMDVHGVSRETGGFLSSILTLSAMVMTPIFGLISDKIGKRATFMMIGSVLIIPVYSVMAYTHVPLYIPMSILGISFSLIPAVMWPSVALIVDEKRLGTAYGLMTMIQNIGLFGTNWLIGAVNDASHGYTNGMLIFSLFGFVGFAIAFLLKRNEAGPNGHGLESPRLKTE